MNGNEPVYIILFFLCLVLSGFFSSSETAFFSLQKLRVEQLVNEKAKGAARVSALIGNPEKLLSVILLGNNLVNTAATALATALAVALWKEQGIIIATIGLSIIVLIFGEAAPKTLATTRSEKLSLLFSRPVEMLSWLFSPVVFLLSSVASLLTKMVGGSPVSRSLISQEEIRTMISVGNKDGTMEETEAKMLHKVFDFGIRPVYEVMIPRTEVVWIEKGTTLEKFMAVYAQSPISRFPVYQENTDNVVGMLAVKDVLMAQAKETMQLEDTIDELVRPIYFTPESKYIDELFVEMRDRNVRMAAVVDEYGGIAGIVSLSLLIEEIVGTVGDEFAEAEKEYEEIDEFTYQIEGGMNIEEANAEMNLGLPDSEDYETVAGFVMSHLGKIPRTGERLRYNGMNMTITEMRGMKIEKILLRKPKIVKEDAAPQS